MTWYIRWIALVLSAGGLVLAFPKWGMYPLSFFALAPSLFICSRRLCPRGGRAFLYGWIVGFLFHLGTLWWIAMLFATEIAYPWLRIPILVSLAAYEALFFGVAYWGWNKVSGSSRWWLWPGIWVLSEYLKSISTLAFPWTLLANSLSQAPLLLQPASLGGVWLLDLGLASVNLLVARAMEESPIPRKVRHLLFAITLIGVWILCGNFLLGNERGTVDVAVVQPNALPEFKWTPGGRGRVFADLKRLTVAAAESLNSPGMKLVLLPETAIPTVVRSGGGVEWWLNEIVDRTDVPLITGALGRKEQKGELLLTNSAYLVLPGRGVIEDRYDKMHLVPFSEKMPFSDRFRWLKKVNFGQGDYAVGSNVVLLDAEGMKVGVLICFEAILPDLARRHVLQGADLLANITNDSWFGDTGAPEQHAAISAIRAVEQRRWMVRAANTGISMVVDPWGRVKKRGGLFRQEILISKVGLRDELTPYAKLGNWVVWLSLALVGSALLARKLTPK